MNAPSESSYQGQELAIFAHARNWKSYWSSLLLAYLHGSVLEVGAGLGSNTLMLSTAPCRRWVCLEPDGLLLDELARKLREARLDRYATVQGTLDQLPAAERFDAIIYIDVLEHIQDDAGELRRAADHLEGGGRLIVLSPAHPSLFSPFDAAIGHYRRYTRKTLLAAAPPSLPLERVAYLDAFGLFLSLGNSLLLKQGLPTVNQILFWDRWVIPLSRLLDPLFGFRAGKSILAVWRKPG
jgi:SAM-dependent methyltransferase